MTEYFVHIGRAKENVEGPFYCVDIGADCGCLLPETEAPELLKTTNDRRHQTYFFKQPTTGEELLKAIEAVNICPIHNIRYGGKDPSIIRKIEGGQSDYIISKNGKVVIGNRNA